MAVIRPFRAIRPDIKVYNRLTETAPQAASVSSDAPARLPLKALLETGARQRPETEEGQARAFADIRQHLQELIATGDLHKQEVPAIYIYQLRDGALVQNGVWAMSALDDHLNGKVRIHERVLTDSVRRLRNYRAHTGLEGSPVLVTHYPVPAITTLITEQQQRQPVLEISDGTVTHRLWAVTDTGEQEQLIQAFGRLPWVYLADGHHRLDSASWLVAQQRVHGKGRDNSPVFDTIGMLYMDTDQIRICEFDRVVLPDPPLSEQDIFQRLTPHFYIRETFTNRPFRPDTRDKFGLYLRGQWYELNLKYPPGKDPGKPGGAPVINAAILQELVLAPVFGIADPSADTRLRCIGGAKAINELEAFVQAHPLAVAFTLAPLTTEELLGTADAGAVLPPKSSWIDPKIPYGLMLYQHENPNYDN